MSKNVVQFLLKASEEDLKNFFAEEIAYCLSMCESGGEQEVCDKVRAQAEAWGQVIRPAERQTEGCRQQPLLRMMIDELREGRAANLEWDDLTFLCTAYEVMKGAVLQDQFARPLELLQPYLGALRARRDALEKTTLLPNLHQRVAFASEQDLKTRPAQEIRKFAGIDLSFRGPVYKHRGFLKIVGSVPDRCAVVVENGSIYVNGYVLGKVAVTGNCEVRETISGMVVSGQRAIRARGLLNQAVVVAKEGRVGCYMAQSPKLVFAGNQIRIAGTAIQGLYMAPRIRVAETVEGGEWHISAAMRAGLFVQTEQRPVTIVFRRGLSSLDYGEAIPSQARSLISARGRLLTHTDYLEQAVAMTNGELQLCINNILTYMCCGEQVQGVVDRIESVKGSISILDRIIAGSTLLKRFTAERARPAGGTGGSTEGDKELDLTLRELESDLRDMTKTGGVLQDLMTTWDTILAQFNTIGAQASSTKVARIMESVHHRLTVWTEQRRLLTSELSALQAKLSELAGKQALLERAQESNNLMGVLQQLIKVALTKPADTPLCQRARSPFVARILRKVQQQNTQLRYHERELGRERQRIKEISQQLEQEYHVPVPRQEKSIRLSSRFQGGGMLYYNGHRQSVDRELFESALPIDDSRGEVVAYRCGEDGQISQVEGEAEPETDADGED